jgi:hypothetical protein
MNKTKITGILIAATLVYVAWLSLSTSGAFQQLQRTVYAQNIISPVKKDLVSWYGTVAIDSAGNSQGTMIKGKSLTNIVQLNANEKNEVYTWVNKEGTNPILNFKLNEKNAIHLNNPTDSKHDLILTTGGKELASSGDILAGKSGKLIVPTLSQGETLTYHCLYHPTTMKGTIAISP